MACGHRLGRNGRSDERPSGLSQCERGLLKQKRRKHENECKNRRLALLQGRLALLQGRLARSASLNGCSCLNSTTATLGLWPSVLGRNGRSDERPSGASAPADELPAKRSRRMARVRYAEHWRPRTGAQAQVQPGLVQKGPFSLAIFAIFAELESGAFSRFLLSVRLLVPYAFPMSSPHLHRDSFAGIHQIQFTAQSRFLAPVRG